MNRHTQQLVLVELTWQRLCDLLHFFGYHYHKTWPQLYRLQGYSWGRHLHILHFASRYASWYSVVVSAVGKKWSSCILLLLTPEEISHSHLHLGDYMWQKSAVCSCSFFFHPSRSMFILWNAISSVPSSFWSSRNRCSTGQGGKYLYTDFKYVDCEGYWVQFYNDNNKPLWTR